MKLSEFWADKVKKLKKEGSNKKVITICEKNLPLPAAFREIMIALRKIIAINQKENKETGKLLNRLYDTAVYHRFLYASPAVILSNKVCENEIHRLYPTFNVAEIAHKKGAMQIIKSIYSDIGYKYLELLNKSDIKWLVNAWGEPINHADPRQIYLTEWNKHLEYFESNIIKSNERIINGLRKLLRSQ
jgi:hypothetical protein